MLLSGEVEKKKSTHRDAWGLSRERERERERERSRLEKNNRSTKSKKSQAAKRDVSSRFRATTPRKYRRLEAGLVTMASLGSKVGRSNVKSGAGIRGTCVCGIRSKNGYHRHAHACRGGTGPLCDSDAQKREGMML